MGRPDAERIFPDSPEAALQTYESTTNGPSTSSTAEQAKEKAKEQAQQVAGQARGTLRSQVDQRSTDAGDRVHGLASDVRSVSEQLREQGKDQPAKLAEQAADRAERVGSYLRDSDADRILNDIEDFGRRQPWVVMAGGIALGLIASRFLKASSSSRYEERYRSRYDTYGRLPARTSDVSPGPGYVGPGVAGSDLGTTRVGTGDLGTTGVGAGDVGSTRVGTGDVGTGRLASDLDAPGLRREPGIDDPAPGRAAEDVSLTGGVMPTGTPGATDPVRRDDGLR